MVKKSKNTKTIIIVIIVIIITLFLVINNLPRSNETTKKDFITVRVRDIDGNVKELNVNSNTPQVFAIVEGIPEVKDIQFDINAENTGVFTFERIRIIQASPTALGNAINKQDIKTNIQPGETVTWTSEWIDADQFNGEVIFSVTARGDYTKAGQKKIVDETGSITLNFQSEEASFKITIKQSSGPGNIPTP